MEPIAENVKRVRERIAEACLRAGRPETSVTLVAVSKTQSPEIIRQAYDAGVRDFGENRVQELIKKYPSYDGARVHMIGHLQTNKAALVTGRCALIQSVDSIRLAQTIDRAAEKKGCMQNVLAELNIAREADKRGLMPEALDEFLDQFREFSHLKLCGLMTIGPKPENEQSNRKYFEKCYRIYVDKRAKTCNNIVLEILSMGMSRDYAAAIEEGATMVRVGTAIFGERFYPAT